MFVIHFPQYPSSSPGVVQMGKIVMMIIFAGCLLVCLVLVVMAAADGQHAAAFLFASFGVIFGCLAASTAIGYLREKGIMRPAEVKHAPQVTFVPHWFMMTALLVCALAVLGSIVLRLFFR